MVHNNAYVQNIKRSALVALSVLCMCGYGYAETVTGNGYVVNQVITPLQGALTGNGYTANQTAQPMTGLFTVYGFNLSSGLTGITSGASVATSTPPSSSSTPSTPSSGGSNGGGFYVLPPEVTGVWPTTGTQGTSSPKPPTSLASSTLITPNGTTCSSRITFTSPIDTTLKNNTDDVKKLETFLNTYEGEKLVVNGVYESRDVEAVKRWQKKYRSYILDPMRLKDPTGTIYTLSQRQIERQTSAPCGEAIVVTKCPFFKANVSYGSRGEEVRKVQQFLNIVQGERLPLSGVFGPLTQAAVKRFQKSRRIYVATFIPFSIATGNWYTTTRSKANETIGCDILR